MPGVTNTLGILNLPVVGESAYQGALRRAQQYAQTQPLRVRLVPESKNPHDPNAVRVDALLGWSKPTVGYLSRANAKRWHAEIRKAGRVELYARLYGGTPDKPSLGIVVGETFG